MTGPRFVGTRPILHYGRVRVGDPDLVNDGSVPIRNCEVTC